MRKIPRWIYSAGIRICVGFWLLFGITQIWMRVEDMRRPVSRFSPTLAQLSALAVAIQTYALDNGAPPTTEQGLEALIRPPTRPPLASNWDGPYLAETRAVPADEWGHAFHYFSPGPNGEPFAVLSYGKDGKPGGEWEDADTRRTPNDTE